MKRMGESLGNAVGLKAGSEAKSAFPDRDKFGRITSLAGIDPRINTAPTVQDVAARLPLFQKALSPKQQAYMAELKTAVEPFKVAKEKQGIEVHTRKDIMQGGFYIPRDRAELEGLKQAVKVGSGRKGSKMSADQVAKLPSMGDGIEAGYRYGDVGQAIAAFGKDTGKQVADAYVANYLKAVGGGVTPKIRLARQNPEIAQKMASLKNELERLKGVAGTMEAKQSKVIDDFLHNPDFDDIDDLRAALDVTVKRGRSAGSLPSDVERAITMVMDDIDEIRPEYKAALKAAQKPSLSEGGGNIGLAGLENQTFPDAIANSMNKALQAEGKTTGKLAPVINAVTTIADTWRSFKATADNSFVMIQGLLGAGDDPKAWAKAIGTS